MEINQFNQKSSSVKLVDVTKTFRSHDGAGEFVAVNKINLSIAEGELVTLLGPSGCGKTTTLRMIAGFEYPTAGQVLIGNDNMASVPPNKRNLGMVFQSYALFPHMSIWENVSYGLQVQRLPKDTIIRRTDAVLELMQLNGLEARFPSQLSGGQQQRVALARAIVIEPAVLLFDEPLSNLDAKLRERMRDELRSLQKRLGITSLYVTHDQAEAMAISDRVVIMKDGDLVQMGSPQEIYEYPLNKFIAHFIGKANFISGTYIGGGSDGADVSIGAIRLHLPVPGNVSLSAGERCALAFRPEHVSLDEPSAEGIPGKVTRATYFGSQIEYEVQIEGSVLVVEIFNPQITKRFAVGDDVKVLLDLACVRVLKDDELATD